MRIKREIKYCASSFHRLDMPKQAKKVCKHPNGAEDYYQYHTIKGDHPDFDEKYESLLAIVKCVLENPKGCTSLTAGPFFADLFKFEDLSLLHRPINDGNIDFKTKHRYLPKM